MINNPKLINELIKNFNKIPQNVIKESIDEVLDENKTIKVSKKRFRNGKQCKNSKKLKGIGDYK